MADDFIASDFSSFSPLRTVFRSLADRLLAMHVFDFSTEVAEAYAGQRQKESMRLWMV